MMRSGWLAGQRAHDDRHETAALYTLGQVLAESGRVDRARTCMSSAFELGDRLGVPEAKQIAVSLATLHGPLIARR